MTALESITKQITEKKEQLENVKGRETEVYTRIVGYYRSVKGWNAGKVAELKIRIPYTFESITKE